MKIWRDTGTAEDPDGKCDNVYQNGELILVADTTVDSNDGEWPLFAPQLNQGDKLVGGETTCLGVAWWIPSDTGNVIQTDSVSGDVSFYIEQARNNPSFVCPGLR